MLNQYLSRVPNIINTRGTYIHTDNLKIKKQELTEIIKIGDFEKIRLFLLSSAVFYDAKLSDILGNHEIHLVYLHRTDIKPIGLETKLIFRTLIADRYNGLAFSDQ